MTDVLTARSIPAADVAEVLHGLTNAMTARAHYGMDHPAAARADGVAAAGFESILARYPEVILALIDDEFVVNERPFPELRKRLGTLADAMSRHQIECMVFQRGITAVECGALGSALCQPTQAETAQKRSELQTALNHVLLRFAALRANDATRRAFGRGDYVVPAVREAIDRTVRAISTGKMCEVKAVRAVAERIVAACEAHNFALEQRAYAEGLVDDAAHAANVALLTGAMMMEMAASTEAAVDAVAAAMLHDIGVQLLPAHIRGVPTPLLSERDAAIFRQHPIVGASALMCSGCPPLWVAAALDHHRGVDGRGYPTIENGAAPHETVRLIALASYFDRRRTIARGNSDEPEEALRRATDLEGRYFGRGTVGHFIRAVGVYPPGTIVELSNGATAIVLHANPADPLRPQVEILFGADAGKRYELKDVAVIEDRYATSIVRAIPPPLAIAPVQDAIGDVVAVAAPASGRTAWPAPPPASLMPRRMSSMPIPREEPEGDSPSDEELPLGVPGVVPRRVTIREMARVRESGDRESAEGDSARIRPQSFLPPPVAKSEAPPDQSALDKLEPLHRIPNLEVSLAVIMALGLDPRAGLVVSMIDGAMTIDEVLDAVGLPRWEVAAILVDLLDRHVITVR